MSELDRALAIAVDAHATQTDKAGEPYILHPIRVMLAVSNGDARIVAVLHDVVEDSGDYDLDALADFEPHIVAAVDALTRRDGEPYAAYIRRVAANDLARTVKVADLRDNLSPSRRASLTDSMIERYERALADIAANAAPSALMSESHPIPGPPPRDPDATCVQPIRGWWLPKNLRPASAPPAPPGEPPR